MATYNVKARKHQTLGAATADIVNLSDSFHQVEVISRDGAEEIYFTIDGSAPTVGGDETYVLPKTTGSLLVSSASPIAQVKLISSATPKYSVCGIA